MKNTLTDLPFLFRPFHACLMLHVVTVSCHFYNLGLNFMPNYAHLAPQYVHLDFPSSKHGTNNLLKNGWNLSLTDYVSNQECIQFLFEHSSQNIILLETPIKLGRLKFRTFSHWVDWHTRHYQYLSWNHFQTRSILSDHSFQTDYNFIKEFIAVLEVIRDLLPKSAYNYQKIPSKMSLTCYQRIQ